MFTALECPICNSIDTIDFVAHKVNRGAYGWKDVLKEYEDDFSYVIKGCQHCKLMYRDQRFSDEDFETLYATEISPNRRIPEYEKYADRSIKVMEFVSQNSNLKFTQKMKILDVGGGRGELTHYFSELGCTVDILEIGVSSEKIKDNLSLIDEIKSNEYDLVIFSHILEHISTPLVFVENILSKVSRDAMIYIEVPYEHVTYLVGRSKGHYEHINYFCETSLKNFINKLGGDIKKVDKLLGFGKKIPVISAVFQNKCKEAEMLQKQYSSQSFYCDAYSAKSLYLFITGKFRFKIGLVSPSHRD